MGRITRDWLISLSCVVATIVISVIPLGGGDGSPLFGYILDAGHFFFYALCAVLTYRHFPLHPATENRRFLTTAITGTVLSGALEIVQPSYGRSASLGDFVASSSGAFFGALCFYPMASRSIRAVHLVAMFCVGAYCLKPAFLEWQNIQLQESMFPTLATFETEEELNWWSGTPTDTLADGTPIGHLATHPYPDYPGKLIPSLVVGFNNLPWYGVKLRLPSNSWAPHQKLVLSLYAESSGSIRIRIDDNHECREAHDRFSEEIDLHQGWNQVTIPLERIQHGPAHRELNLANLKRLFLYSSPESKITSFRIGKIVLS